MMDIQPRRHRRHNSSSSFRRPPVPTLPSSSWSTGEPSSPRVGCTGHIKRSKTMLSTPAADATFHDGKLLEWARSFWRRRSSSVGRRTCAEADLDPPRPVAKHVRRSTEVVSLWNRRSGGEELKVLQMHRQCVHWSSAA
ncbi:hypothetical protein MUK42_07049 [Musa troglodytarum]|uniref:Uncharacterized protein n=1 Tax=Musa troglodytarum TaxID=320322 RepID=A0A9E7GXV4_9LILI|nr:hypothetical protein MUK42_07049 [Musa troglodytarum]